MQIITKARALTFAVVVALTVAAAVPAAQSHEIKDGPYAGTYPHETEEWFSLWLELVDEVGGLTPELVALRADLFDADAVAAEALSGLPLELADLASSRGDQPVDRWRPLVSRYFHHEDIEWALGIIACESRGDPNARNRRSSARGLFQHLGKYWDERSHKAGWAGASIFDPEANIAVAAWLFYSQGGKKHWTCRA